MRLIVNVSLLKKPIRLWHLQTACAGRRTSDRSPTLVNLFEYLTPSPPMEHHARHVTSTALGYYKDEHDMLIFSTRNRYHYADEIFNEIHQSNKTYTLREAVE